jgi:ribonuclease HI
MHILATQLVEGFDSCIKIFTDASRDSNGVVGIGVVLYELDGKERTLSLRASDGVSVTTAELLAIKEGLKMTKQLKNDDTGIVLFTDSRSAVDSLSSYKEVMTDELVSEIQDLLASLKERITLTWLPSHVGVEGNDRADLEAGKGRARQTIDISINDILKEGKRKTKLLTTSLWQEEWTGAETGRHYYAIEPKVGTGLKLFMGGNRRVNTSINRLRFGTCGLNHHLFKIGISTTPLCIVCGEQEETIDHFLLKCKKSRVVDEITQKCAIWQIPCDLSHVLRDGRTLGLLASILDRPL